VCLSNIDVCSDCAGTAAPGASGSEVHKLKLGQVGLVDVRNRDDLLFASMLYVSWAGSILPSNGGLMFKLGWILRTASLNSARRAPHQTIRFTKCVVASTAYIA
jgi:hypothetical protein